jgi:hypothetical protein
VKRGAIVAVVALLWIPAVASAQFISGGGGATVNINSGWGIATVVGALVVGTCGWFGTAFIGSPIRRFFDLRGEIIRQLVRFANVQARFRTLADSSGAESGKLLELSLPDSEKQRLILAMDTFRDLGSQMSTFAQNERFALRVTRALGYDPVLASSSLIGLSNTLDRYGAPERISNRAALLKALKLNSTD